MKAAFGRRAECQRYLEKKQNSLFVALLRVIQKQQRVKYDTKNTRTYIVALGKTPVLVCWLRGRTLMSIRQERTAEGVGYSCLDSPQKALDRLEPGTTSNLVVIDWLSNRIDS